VARMTSGERVKTVTVMCVMNAAGTYLPPMFIYPRKRMVESPPVSIGVCTASGECFMKWLRHFVNTLKPSKEDKYIVFLDGHHSHKTTQAVTWYRTTYISAALYS
jgi:hypothetical protein